MMQSKKNWNWSRILKYHTKWQLSFIILWPCLELLQKVAHLNSAWSLILSNFIGALLFYPIDLLIFKKRNKA